jgi:hypothetical protein
MIPFFRKIRKKMADDNRPLKYMRYAIGEIVLVVIGILIALQINNWNEERKKREKFDLVLVEVKKELVLNIENARLVLDYYHRIDSLSNIFLFDSLSLEDYKKTSLRPLFLGQGFYPFNIQADAYKKLIEYSEDISVEQDSAIIGLKELYGEGHEVIKSLNKRTESIVLETTEGLVNYPWYSEVRARKRPHDYLEYLAYDQIHKNMVSKYMMVAIGGLVLNTQYFEKSARDCYRNINNYLANKYPNHSEPVQFEYDINDYTYLVGTYKVIWDSTNRYSNSFTMEGDSTVISVQNGKLFYTPYYSNSSISGGEIISVNKSYFRTEFYRGYYQIVYDDQGNLERVDYSGRNIWIKAKKIP